MRVNCYIRECYKLSGKKFISWLFRKYVVMFHYSYTVKNISHSPAARAKKYLFYIRIKTLIYIQLCNTRVKKAISAQRPNGKNGSMYTRVDIGI